VLSGIRRTIGAAPVRKRAATSDMVIAMSATGASLRALRDRAIILLGFAGAFRRSELVALDTEDLEEAPEGLLITIRRSKTDQEGIGRKVAIPRGEIACPVAALRAWLEAAGITEGVVFRRIFNKRAQRVTNRRLAARNVATIVKAAAAKLGLEAGRRYLTANVIIRSRWATASGPAKTMSAPFGSAAIRSMAFSRSDRLLTESATDWIAGDKLLSRSGSCRCMAFAGS
jgi:integrase